MERGPRLRRDLDGPPGHAGHVHRRGGDRFPASKYGAHALRPRRRLVRRLLDTGPPATSQLTIAGHARRDHHRHAARGHRPLRRARPRLLPDVVLRGGLRARPAGRGRWSAPRRSSSATALLDADAFASLGEDVDGRGVGPRQHRRATPTSRRRPVRRHRRPSRRSRCRRRRDGAPRRGARVLRRRRHRQHGGDRARGRPGPRPVAGVRHRPARRGGGRRLQRRRPRRLPAPARERARPRSRWPATPRTPRSTPRSPPGDPAGDRSRPPGSTSSSRRRTDQAGGYVATDIAPPGWGRLRRGRSPTVAAASGGPDGGRAEFTSDDGRRARDRPGRHPDRRPAAAPATRPTSPTPRRRSTPSWTAADALAAGRCRRYLELRRRGPGPGRLELLGDGAHRRQEAGAGLGRLPGPVRRAARLVPGALHLARGRRQTDVEIQVLLSSEGEIESVSVSDISLGGGARRASTLENGGPLTPYLFVPSSGGFQLELSQQVHPGQRQDRGRLPEARQRHVVRHGRRRRRPRRQLRHRLRHRDRALTRRHHDHASRAPPHHRRTAMTTTPETPDGGPGGRAARGTARRPLRPRDRGRARRRWRRAP